MRKRNSSFTE